MNTNTFTATPMMQSFAPSKSFTSADDALRYAETAAQQFGIGYAVWECIPQLRKLRTFPANHKMEGQP